MSANHPADFRAADPLVLESGEPAVFNVVTASARDATITRAAASALVSVHTWDLSCVTRPPESLVTALPGVDPAQLAHLDEHGRARVGSRVSAGMVLVAMTRPNSELLKSPEQRALEQLRGAAASIRDCSLRCPPHVHGVVTDVRIADDGITTTVCVSLRRELVIGDVLRADDGSLAVVGQIVEHLPDRADLVWPGREGPHQIFKVACVEDRSYARSIGPYSLVTHQPLGGIAQFGGQRVGPGAIKGLLDRNARLIVHEMLTVKSDDLQGRLSLYESIVRCAPACTPTIPIATRVLESELRALGFQVDFTAAEPAIALATTASIRAMAPGEVVKPDTIHFRTHRPQPGGLFCEDIFGAIGSDDRRGRFGRIELPVPVLHPWTLPMVTALLERTEAEITAALQADGAGPRALRDSLAAIDLEACAQRTDARGAIARAMIEASLRPDQLMLEAWPVLPPDLRPLVPLKGGLFATSDLNDLYRRVINTANRLRRLAQLNAPAAIVRNEESMLQSAIETMVHNGRFREAICFEERPLKSLVHLIAGPQGRFAANLLGKRVDYSGVAPVVARDDLTPDRARIPREIALELWKPFVYGLLEQLGHVSRIKEAKAMFTARDPLVFEALDRVVRSHPLVLLPEIDSDRAAGMDVELWDERAIALSPRAISALGIGVGDAVALHVPCDPRAVEEARTLLRGVRLVREDGPDDNGWIARSSRAELSEIGRVLNEAALRCERDPATGTTARLVLGRPL